MEKFSEGSKGILTAMVEATTNGACTIIGMTTSCTACNM